MLAVASATKSLETTKSLATPWLEKALSPLCRTDGGGSYQTQRNPFPESLPSHLRFCSSTANTDGLDRLRMIRGRQVGSGSLRTRKPGVRQPLHLPTGPRIADLEVFRKAGNQIPAKHTMHRTCLAHWARRTSYLAILSNLMIFSRGKTSSRSGLLQLQRVLICAWPP